MKRKTNAFLLALYLFLSSSFYGCSKIKNNEDEVENEVISMEENKNETLEEIIEETIGTTIETIIPTEEIIETEPIETEPNVTEEVVIEGTELSLMEEVSEEVSIELTSFESRLGDFPILQKSPVVLTVTNQENKTLFSRIKKEWLFQYEQHSFLLFNVTQFACLHNLKHIEFIVNKCKVCLLACGNRGIA